MYMFMYNNYICRSLVCGYLNTKYLALFPCLQIVGHIFANTMAYDLLAQSEEEKQEVRTVLDSIMGE